MNSSLEATLGRPVRDEVYRILEKKGITRSLVPSMFDQVVAILSEVFGEGYRLLVHRTVADLYQAYYQRIDFSLGDSTRNHLMYLKEKVIADHLRPRGAQEDALDSFFDNRRSVAQNNGG